MKTKYLGDGVYAEFDGYHIVLKANSLTHPTDTIYLDPEVMASLVDYAERLADEEDNEEQ